MPTPDLSAPRFYSSITHILPISKSLSFHTQLCRRKKIMNEITKERKKEKKNNDNNNLKRLPGERSGWLWLAVRCFPGVLRMCWREYQVACTSFSPSLSPSFPLFFLSLSLNTHTYTRTHIYIERLGWTIPFLTTITVTLSSHHPSPPLSFSLSLYIYIYIYLSIYSSISLYVYFVQSFPFPCL